MFYFPEFDQYLFDHRDGILAQQTAEYNAKMEHGRAILEGRNSNNNIPKCPTCGSTNLERISLSSKVVSTALFGLFSTKRHKTFRCKNCGYEW